MQPKIVARGDLFFLWHPDTRFTFSGYGLVVETGHRDLLHGILMVDRPYPVSALWLESVQQTFGEIFLYAMTATHERGIACQMRIAADSLPYVCSLSVPMAQRLRRALMPLLAQPPKPRFLLKWEPTLRLWQSEFDVTDAPSAVQPPKPALFRLGQVVATPGALDALQKTGQMPTEFLERHITGDWGNLVEEDKQENERALRQGSRLFSAYNLTDETRIWVITEWDRSVTTILLPSEY